MKELAKSYIEKRIQQTRTVNSDSFVASDTELYGKTRAELARREAKHGFTLATASHLLYDNTLPVSQNGEILAEAYTKDAERSALLTTSAELPYLQDVFKNQAQRYKRIAQGLTRAAQRSHNS